ncbi:palladin isoform X2 [Scyliorhinus canicula]|uniref:palladin isoform X2 n=1 Tax=Scyliorhinus canicula TaxID=7830 RepID=UPI0018F67E7C|nr:palladin isoform X2 [Scyliorhinus canicula]
MQEGSHEHGMPLSQMLKEAYSAGKVDGYCDSMMSEASSHDLYFDSLSDLQEDRVDGSPSLELSAFLSQEEMCKSLDLARVAIAESSSEETEPESELGDISQYFHHRPLAVTPEDPSVAGTQAAHRLDIPAMPISQKAESGSSAIATDSSPAHLVASPELQTSPPNLPSTGPSFEELDAQAPTNSNDANPAHNSKRKDNPYCQGESSAKNEFCTKTVSFIEELSSIFRTAKPRNYGQPKNKTNEEEGSSTDSGYLSPKNHIKVNTTGKSKPLESKLTAVTDLEPSTEAEQGQGREPISEAAPKTRQQVLTGSAPRFIQKLKSQEVAEGSTVRLECRVLGDPSPLVRWFCEGKGLENSPDVQIFQHGDLYTLAIAEAFEDDTGRYTCTAANCLGSDTTSAEVYIEGASSTDSEGERDMFKSRAGTMPQPQKKSTSVSLTIGAHHSKGAAGANEVQQVRSTLVQSISIPAPQIQSPTPSLPVDDGVSPPVFTKVLQDISASEGQVVVLECRVKGTPPVKIHWLRQGTEIEDSPDFRILQKKPRSAVEPEEEICSLVIAETFAEDVGRFTCTATNLAGTISCSAQLTLCPGKEVTSNNGIGSVDNLSPLPQTEISLLELPVKTTVDPVQVNSFEIKPNVAAFQLQLNAVEKIPNGNSPSHQMNGPNRGQLTQSVATLPSPAKEPPPLATKPKLDPLRLQQLQNQILLEQQGESVSPNQQTFHLPPCSPSSNQLSPAPMSVLNPHTPPTMQQTTTFNYARPKQFIAAQSLPSSAGYLSPSGSSGSSLSSPLSPPTSHKPFNRVASPPFPQPYPGDGEQWRLASPSTLSPRSSSPPLPPPPPVFSPPIIFAQDPFPLPPPPPPLLPSPVQPAYFSPSAVRASPHSTQSPSAFLSSVLPSQSIVSPVNALGLPKGAIPITPQSLKRNSRTPRLATDEEIQGTKDAVIQDLERKLRFKDDRLSNGQKLTYEEKMARRLLGADNAATVFNFQEAEDEPATQEYKVSSFEQRLISEIEFRLERSPVDESDEEVQHDELLQDGTAPVFEKKLKHVKLFEGTSVTFTCKVIADPVPKVYWFKDGKQISKCSEHYQIQREADGTCSLHTEAATLDDDGNYTIMVANPLGRTSCTSRLMVQTVGQRGRSPRSPAGQSPGRRPRSRSRDSGEETEAIQERFFRPHFLQAPGDMVIQEGKLCRMDCKVSGLPTPDLIWQLNGMQIRSDNSHKMLVRENGVHSLVIEPATARDAGMYTCIATNRAGQNSFSLELIVAAKEMVRAPVFIEKLQNTGVAEGYPIRLECRVFGVPYPQLFWKKDNESLIQNTERVSMHHDNKGYICLLIQPTTKEDSAWYTVSAKNEAGIISCTAKLDVYTPQWHQNPSSKPKKVRPSASRYAALTDQGLDIKSAFLPEANPTHLGPQSNLVESDDL